MVNAYFGSTFSSRLNQNIRVSRNWPTGQRSFSSPTLGRRIRGQHILQNRACGRDDPDHLEEIRRLRSQPPSADELHKVKSCAARDISTQCPTPQQIAEQRWLAEVQELPSDYQRRQREKVKTTTAEDCIRLIHETIDPATMVIVVVGPAETLRMGLERIAPVTVVHPQTSTDVVGVG